MTLLDRNGALRASADSEAGELWFATRARPFDFAHVTVKSFLHRLDEGVDLGRLALRLHLHPPVRQISHETGDFEFLGDLKGRETKPDPLHVSGEKGRFVSDLRHEWRAHQRRGRGQIQLAKRGPDLPDFDLRFKTARTQFSASE